MTAKAKTVLSLIINGVILLVTTGVMISYFISPGELIENGWDSFKFFTTDSNVLAAVGCGAVAVCDILMLKKKINKIPHAGILLKYMGVIGLMLTFFTVLVLLVPAYGVALEYGGTGFHMHLSAPVAAFLSLVLLDGERNITLAQTPLGLVPVVFYGVFYMMQVVVLCNWWDFYLFNQGGMWYVTMPVIIALSYGMCLLVRLLYNRKRRRQR